MSPSYIVNLFAHNLVVIIRGTAGAGPTIDVVSEFLCALFVPSLCPLCALFVPSLCPLLAILLQSSPRMCTAAQSFDLNSKMHKAVTFLIADCTDRRPLYRPTPTVQTDAHCTSHPSPRHSGTDAASLCIFLEVCLFI